MQNKYIILIVVIVLITGGIFFYKHSNLINNPSVTETPKIEIDHTTANPDLSIGTFTFDNENITLKNGKAETSVSPDSSETQITTLTDKIAYGDLNSDGKTDGAAVIVQEGAGTGVFIYVSAYISGTVRYNGTNSVFVGDRITPQSISIEKGVITLKYLDRAEGEPFSATPSVPSTISLVYVNGELKALK